jgi:hypothetical protein
MDTKRYLGLIIAMVALLVLLTIAILIGEYTNQTEQYTKEIANAGVLYKIAVEPEGKLYMSVLRGGRTRAAGISPGHRSLNRPGLQRPGTI